MKSYLLLCFVCFPLCLFAQQILPREGSTLNYRIVGFAHPVEKGAIAKLQIAEGFVDNESAFAQHIIKSSVKFPGREIITLPSFGKEYTWRVLLNRGAGKETKGALHHFKIRTAANVDTSVNRLRVTENSGTCKDCYVLVDATQAMYDMDGNPVWFYPDPGNSAMGNSNIRDLRLTQDGTATFLAGELTFEINYNGRILWRGPQSGEISGDKTEHFHHELTKLSNGHYMVLGNKAIQKELTGYQPDTTKAFHAFAISRDSNNVVHQRLLFATLLEYDKDGKLLWHWSSEHYFLASDIYAAPSADGRYAFTESHGNAFFFDEAHKIIYVGFRDISRILKISYPEGEVLAEYGLKYTPGNEVLGNQLFCGQHSIVPGEEGELFIFNNNSFDLDSMPRLEIVREPASSGQDLEQVWEYRIDPGNVEPIPAIMRARREQAPTRGKAIMSSGGNFYQLPDGTLFASASGQSCILLILDRSKQILWSAIPERWMIAKKSWSPIQVYRASIIFGRKELDHFIWAAE